MGTSLLPTAGKKSSFSFLTQHSESQLVIKKKNEREDRTLVRMTQSHAGCSAVNGFIIRALWPPQAACLHPFKCTVLHGAGQFLTSQQYYCPVEVQLEHCWGLSPQETWTGCLLGGLAVWAVGKHPAAGFKA